MLETCLINKLLQIGLGESEQTQCASFCVFLVLNEIFKVWHKIPYCFILSIEFQWNDDEHAWLLPSEIAWITLVYSSFKLIRAPAIIITLFQPLLWHCNHLFETKNYQSMLNWHFVITTRIASRNYLVHKSALYQHSFVRRLVPLKPEKDKILKTSSQVFGSENSLIQRGN